LGIAFIGEIEHCLERASEVPRSFQVIHHGLRRAAVRRFPYCVYFREDADGIFVLAVFHASRDPMLGVTVHEATKNPRHARVLLSRKVRPWKAVLVLLGRKAIRDILRLDEPRSGMIAKTNWCPGEDSNLHGFTR